MLNVIAGTCIVTYSYFDWNLNKMKESAKLLQNIKVIMITLSLSNNFKIK